MVLAVAAACSGGLPGDDSAAPPQPGRRTLIDHRWQELFHVGGVVQDTLLQAPDGLAADAGGVYVADPVAGRVLRFAADGRLVFSAGRRGGGPDEFRSIRDLGVDGRGRVWVLDRSNARVTVLDPSGATIARVPLEGPARSADQLVPLASGREAVLAVYDRERPFARVALDGRIEERFGLPWPGFSGLEPLASQLVVAGGGGDRWAAAFGLGDGFFVREAGRWSGGRVRYVERTPFPRVETRGKLSPEGSGRVEERIAGEDGPVFAAISASLVGDRLVALFGGRSAERGRLLDVYALPDGRYRGSLVLPDRFERVSLAGDRLYGLVARPVPRLVAYALPVASLP
jgi:hypothetical protein